MNGDDDQPDLFGDDAADAADDIEPPPPDADDGAPGDDTPGIPNAPARHTSEGGPLKRLIDDNFLQYASYVIRDRAIPELIDGLKPVQRRILYALHETDDGKFTKVANIVGHAMQYHPHGDASIYGALVALVNRGHLVEGQGNFGNIFTGDPAAAARYIECRLTDLARGEVFNNDLTRFVPSYDGRRKEPVTLPTKLPLLLLLGAEGIAVGLSTRIFPHNFRELIEAQIAILQKKPFEIVPDFRQAGLMDISEYNRGNGKVRLRARIEKADENRLIVREIPFTTTTDSLINSIEQAGRKRKLKLRSINDFTADVIEIEIRLAPDQDPDTAIQALYAFTQCEVSLSGRVVVLDNNRPAEMDVDSVLHANTKRLVEILRRELEWDRRRLEDEAHRKTLVQIFVENRIYKRIEEARTAAEIQKEMLAGFEPFKDRLRREITLKDLEMLLGIPIRKITRFDMEKSRREVEAILEEIAEIEKRLKKLVAYAIRYLRTLLRDYGDDEPRRTKIVTFEEVEIREITAEELTLCHDKEKGYLGHALGGDGEPILTCSSYDKIICVWGDGRYRVTPPPDKVFVDQNMVYCAVFDRDRVMTVVYDDKPFTYLKRFTFGGAIMNRDYNCAADGAKVLYFSDTEPQQLFVRYHKAKRQRIDKQVFDMKKVAVRGVKAKGLQMTSKRVRAVTDTKPRTWGKDDDTPGGVVLDF